MARDGKYTFSFTVEAEKQLLLRQYIDIYWIVFGRIPNNNLAARLGVLRDDIVRRPSRPSN